MSKEEIKEKIELLKEFLEYGMEYKDYFQLEKAFEDILNLIEKQQKEIETLSTQNAMMSERHLRDSEKLRNSVSKDKIRKQIKILEEIAEDSSARFMKMLLEE